MVESKEKMTTVLEEWSQIYRKSFSDFQQIVQQYSFQCHLPYHPKEVERKLGRYTEIIERLLSLRSTILANETHLDLQKLYLSWEKKYIIKNIYDRSSDQMFYFHHKERKLPTGSNQVIPDLHNARFLLSRIALLLSQCYFHHQYQMSQYEQYLKESYIWYPKSCEVCNLLGELHKVIAINSDILQESEFFFRRAIQLGMTQIDSSSSSSSSSTSYREEEIANAEKAGEALLLLLYQSKRTTEADEILQQTQKYRWKINEDILSFIPSASSINTINTTHTIDTTSPTSLSTPDASLPSDTRRSSAPIFYLQDNYLPQEMLEHLQWFFRNESSFWSEHNYNFINNQSMISGYFSYLYPFRERTAMCSIEQIIDYLFATLLSLHREIFQDVCVAEWWVHTRPHCSGHQLHYDSDESRIEKGGSPNHPIASCVFYLSSANSLGGPTMISDQILNQTIGTQAWLVPPKENRVFVFDAKYLHGVIPGVGSIPAIATETTDSRRLTFMVGFWRSLEARDKGRDCVGAGQSFPLLPRPQPLPSTTEKKEEEDESMLTRFTWPYDLQKREGWTIDTPNNISSSNYSSGKRSDGWTVEDLNRFGIAHLQPLWKPVITTTTAATAGAIQDNNSNNSNAMENVVLPLLPSLEEDYQCFYQGF